MAIMGVSPDEKAELVPTNFKSLLGCGMINGKVRELNFWVLLLGKSSKVLSQLLLPLELREAKIQEFINLLYGN